MLEDLDDYKIQRSLFKKSLGKKTSPFSVFEEGAAVQRHQDPQRWLSKMFRFFWIYLRFFLQEELRLNDNKIQRVPETIDRRQEKKKYFD